MTAAAAFDLVVLVPGADERETLDELLARRPSSLGIREVRYRLLKHTQRTLQAWFPETPATHTDKPTQ